MAKKSDTQRAIENLEGQIAVIQLALDVLKDTQTQRAVKPSKVTKRRKADVTPINQGNQST